MAHFMDCRSFSFDNQACWYNMSCFFSFEFPDLVFKADGTKGLFSLSVLKKISGTYSDSQPCSWDLAGLRLRNRFPKDATPSQYE